MKVDKYVSPISLYFAGDRWVKELEDGIVQKLNYYDINIDKEELKKALQYDRDQYEKGVVDGYRDAYEHFFEVREEIESLLNDLEDIKIRFAEVLDKLKV